MTIALAIIAGACIMGIVVIVLVLRATVKTGSNKIKTITDNIKLK